ncbi:uncharacterized protein LOC119279259 [Triticum dicoccoides]|uniref:uncharacterized protein LOC119279259 n=1 Tax=Triticum dicoccoides TaxID=85692 RepID=UPI00188FB436|nr:uncharacterized protein LOC119279259 [Triticum dicoccoides]
MHAVGRTRWEVEEDLPEEIVVIGKAGHCGPLLGDLDLGAKYRAALAGQSSDLLTNVDLGFTACLVGVVGDKEWEFKSIPQQEPNAMSFSCERKEGKEKKNTPVFDPQFTTWIRARAPKWHAAAAARRRRRAPRWNTKISSVRPSSSSRRCRPPSSTPPPSASTDWASSPTPSSSSASAPTTGRLRAQRRQNGVQVHPRSSRPHPSCALQPATSNRRLLEHLHARALLVDQVRNQLIVCDSVTGGQHRVALPPAFGEDEFSGAVLCAATDHDHVHGSCSSSPFKVVLVSLRREDNRTMACVYSSEIGAWGNLTSTPAAVWDDGSYGILVGNALYFLLYDISDGILEIDLGEESLAVIRGPPVMNDFCHGSPHIIQGEDGALGLAILYCSRIQMWQRSSNCHGVATWVLWKTVEMHNVLGLPPQIESRRRRTEIIVGYAEDDNVLFIDVDANVYMVYLKSMQSKRLYEAWPISSCHPFTSFYTPGTTAPGGSDEGEMLHNT